MEAPDGKVSFRSQGVEALPAQVFHDSSGPARAYLRRGSLVEELYCSGRLLSLPYMRQPITRQRRLLGLQLSCGSKGPLLSWWNVE